MRRVVAAFVEGHDLGRCFVRVSYCVLLLAVDIECSRGIVRVCGGVNDGVAIE